MAYIPLTLNLSEESFFSQLSCLFWVLGEDRNVGFQILMKGVMLARVAAVSTLISCTYARLVALSELSGELTKHDVA